jgi:muramoyltetrapeptide carboxypeptidase LdcA involved in peptidoglycan recycling
MDQSPNINMYGLQNLVNQIVASNLTGVIFSRMETYKAEEPNKDYSLEENYDPLAERATRDVMAMYGIIWEALEKWSNNLKASEEDSQADT